MTWSDPPPGIDGGETSPLERNPPVAVRSALPLQEDSMISTDEIQSLSTSGATWSRRKDADVKEHEVSEAVRKEQIEVDGYIDDTRRRASVGTANNNPRTEVDET